MALDPSGVPSRAAIVGAASTTVTAGSGWGGSTSVERRGDVIDVTLDITKATWSTNDAVGTLPSGFRPTGLNRWIPAMNRSSGATVWIKIDSSGAITALQAGTVGLVGSLTFIV